MCGFAWQARCRVQLWRVGMSESDVQMLFDVGSQEYPSALQLVRDVMSMSGLSYVEKALFSVESGSDQGKQEELLSVVCQY